MAPHDETLWHVRLQSLPHDDVHVLTSWQSDEQPLPHTVPQVSPTLWQSCEQPSPVHPRKQSLPPLHTHASPGSQPSAVLQSVAASDAIATNSAATRATAPPGAALRGRAVRSTTPSRSTRAIRLSIRLQRKVRAISGLEVADAPELDGIRVAHHAAQSGGEGDGPQSRTGGRGQRAFVRAGRTACRSCPQS